MKNKGKGEGRNENAKGNGKTTREWTERKVNNSKVNNLITVVNFNRIANTGRNDC